MSTRSCLHHNADERAGVDFDLKLHETALLGLQAFTQCSVFSELALLQVDGQLRTGRDLAVAALLGAEEFGSAQPSALIPVWHMSGTPTQGPSALSGLAPGCQRVWVRPTLNPNLRVAYVRGPNTVTECSVRPRTRCRAQL